MKRSILLLLLWGITSIGFAKGWVLNNEESQLHFVSIKKGSVAEVHSIQQLSGSVDKNGNIKIVLDLNSVETHIAVRNKRMQKILFETQTYPQAVLTGKMQKHIACGFQEGIAEEHTIEAELELHGVKKKITLPLIFTKINSYALNVVSKQPIIINAADFNLLGGVNALRDIAKLSAISYAVPVDFSLIFEKKK